MLVVAGLTALIFLLATAILFGRKGTTYEEAARESPVKWLKFTTATSPS